MIILKLTTLKQIILSRAVRARRFGYRKNGINGTEYHK